MKLIYCDWCQDVFKLARNKVRSCECGRCVGAYEADGHHAWTNGNGYQLAIGNGSLHQALRKLNSQGFEAGDKDFYIENCQIKYAWARPHSGPGNPRCRVKGA